MNDYALARLLHSEYQNNYSSPDVNENVQFTRGIKFVSVIAGLPLAIYFISAVLN